jgi:hypothetical protein
VAIGIRSPAGVSSDLVTLSATGLPPGVSALFSPAVIAVGDNSVLTLTASKDAPAVAGRAVTITGTRNADNAVASGTLSVTVTPTFSPLFSYEKVSVASDGTDSDGLSNQVSITPDGRFAAFDSYGTNLVAGDLNGVQDVFLRDRCIGATTSCVPSTARISVASDGTPGNGDSLAAHISATGRYVVFSSVASNLVPGDSNQIEDVFLRDTCFGAPAGCSPTTILVSIPSSGAQSATGSLSTAQGTTVTVGHGSLAEGISNDARYVVFSSDASNLVRSDVFLRDTCIGAPPGCFPSTTLISVATDGTPGNDSSGDGSVSNDGRFVAFASYATNLVALDTNGVIDTYLRDTCTGAPLGCTPTTLLVSTASDGTQGNGASSRVSISTSGRFVVFASQASNLVAGDTNGVADIFVRDTCLGAGLGCIASTTRVSIASDGTQGDQQADINSLPAQITPDGRFIAFGSGAENLVPGATSGGLFIRDTCLGATGSCSTSTVQVLASYVNGANPSLSPDGRIVSFVKLTDYTTGPGATLPLFDVWLAIRK